MSARSMAVVWSAAGLLGLATSGAIAQDVRVPTDVDVVTLQAGEAFAFDDDTLSEAGKEKLDSMLDMMDPQAVVRVDVSGYTDQIGDESYNVDLSGRRATSVAGYLVTAGIPGDKIQVLAMGSANPIVTCEGTSGDDKIACLAPNRRTEVRFSYVRIEDTKGSE